MVEHEKVEIPRGVAPRVIEIIEPIISEVNLGNLVNDLSVPLDSDSGYGHAMTALVQSAFGNASLDEKGQLDQLRERARHYLDIFGPKLLEKMGPRLLEALGIKE